MSYTLLRVENHIEPVGLWYNRDGEFTEWIKHGLSNAQARDLPMDYDEFYKQEGGDWISACDKLEDMKQWFSYQDLREMEGHGFKLYAFEVPHYRLSPGPIVHAVFQRKHVTEQRELSMSLLEE